MGAAEEAKAVRRVQVSRSSSRRRRTQIATTAMQTALDRLHTSQGQLLEAVAQQMERIKRIELQLLGQDPVGNIPQEKVALRREDKIADQLTNQSIEDYIPVPASKAFL